MKNEISDLRNKLPNDARWFFNHLTEDEIKNLIEKLKFTDLKPKDL
jgi:hypothetical protein